MCTEHNAAIRIEFIMRSALKCEAGEWGGFVTADEISKHPFVEIVGTLAYLIGKSDTMTTGDFGAFYQRYSMCASMSLGELLELNSEDCERLTGLNGLSNGESLVEKLISDFRSLL